MTDAMFFGCWNQAGHYLHAPGGHAVRGRTPFDYFSGGVSLDGSYAPRRGTKGKIHGVAVCWTAQGDTKDDRQRIYDDSEELDQGLFLRHEVAGYTLISWWDRTQGDGRSACNSTFLLKGSHTSAAMLVALRDNFPHVRANLERAGVGLREVTIPDAPPG